MPAQTPNVFTYPRNEPGTQGHLDLVEPLRTLPRRPRRRAQGHHRRGSDVPTRRRTSGASRSIVGHLRDAAEVYHKRLYMMSTQTDPVLEPYDQERSSPSTATWTRDIDEMLRELAR